MEDDVSWSKQVKVGFWKSEMITEEAKDHLELAWGRLEDWIAT
jgi:hypothetical protein